MEKSFDRYFLAANSFEGFVSHFSDSYSAESGYKTYIIKGGPGTGKSSLMKYVAIRAIEKGYTVHLCHCSSDPDSLDGVIIDEKKTVILDGTAPHIVEPKYPGTCENIVDLGRFWDSENLRSKRIDIINATNINKSFHKNLLNLVCIKKTPKVEAAITFIYLLCLIFNPLKNTNDTKPNNKANGRLTSPTK